MRQTQRVGKTATTTNCPNPGFILAHNQIQTRTILFTEDDTQYKMIVNLRYDDQYRSGHNSFGMTADVYRKGKNGRWYEDSFGCQHELIVKHCPDLEPYTTWHLCSSDGPWGYVENTVYHASSKDCWGYRKGEPKDYKTSLKFGDFPIVIRPGYRVSDYDESFLKWLEGLENYDLEVMAVEHAKGRETFKAKYTFLPYAADSWHKCPFDTEREALEFLQALQTYPPTFTKEPTAWGEGKEPNLDAARESAIWPEATDNDLREEGLKERLEARLPQLLKEFQEAMESLGFTF